MEQSSLEQPTGTHAFTTIPRIIAAFHDEDVRVFKLIKETGTRRLSQKGRRTSPPLLVPSLHPLPALSSATYFHSSAEPPSQRAHTIRWGGRSRALFPGCSGVFLLPRRFAVDNPRLSEAPLWG